jgi:hypothetical protein
MLTRMHGVVSVIPIRRVCMLSLAAGLWNRGSATVGLELADCSHNGLEARIGAARPFMYDPQASPWRENHSGFLSGSWFACA